MKPLKCLMFGSSGQVAQEVKRLVKKSDILVTALNRQQADLSKPMNCASYIKRSDADLVINAAAYTDVNAAESSREDVMLINAEAPGVMAKTCSERGIPFFHISSDYVFDGCADRPWKEECAANPLNVYGHSKLLGETLIKNEKGPYVIIRTSGVFSVYGNNFVKTMLQLSHDQTKPLTVVNDQFLGPTPAFDIAAVLIKIARRFQAGDGVAGIFHYCGRPTTSWYHVAESLFRSLGDDTDITLRDIPSTDLKMAASRPLFSALDCSKIYNSYGISQPDWSQGMASVLYELQQKRF